MRLVVGALVLLEMAGIYASLLGSAGVRAAGLIAVALSFCGLLAVVAWLSQFLEWVVQFDRHRFGNWMQLARGWLQLGRLEDMREVVRDACNEMLSEGRLVSQLGPRGGARLMWLYRKAEQRGIKVKWPVWNAGAMDREARTLAATLSQELCRPRKAPGSLNWKQEDGQWVWQPQATKNHAEV